MAINKAIIQIRRGLKDDLQIDKLLPGELAIATDAPCMWFCWSVGNVEQVPTSDNLSEVVADVLKKYLEENPVVGISEIYMRVYDGYIQYSSDNQNWENVISIEELKGEKGDPGEKGDAGVGIIEITQETGSLDGGENKISIHLSDGSVKTISIYNGATGEPGPAGSDASVTAENIKSALGYTPANAEKLDRIFEDVLTEVETVLSSGTNKTLTLGIDYKAGDTLKFECLTENTGVAEISYEIYMEPSEPDEDDDLIEEAGMGFVTIAPMTGSEKSYTKMTVNSTMLSFSINGYVTAYRIDYKNASGSETGGDGTDNSAVKYEPQDLTDDQKAQARTNIGAASEADKITISYDAENKIVRFLRAGGTLLELPAEKVVEYYKLLTDTDLTAAGVPADAAAVGERFGKLSQEIVDLSEDVAKLKAESEVKVGKNKLNLDALTEGYYLWADGSLEVYSGRWVTDYISVSAGDIVTISYTKNGEVTPYLYNSICLYDANKKVVSGGDYNKGTFTVPNGVVYVRLTLGGYMCDASYYPQIELTTDGVPTSYVPYDVVEDEETTVKLITAIPPIIHISVGNEFKMYYKNVLSCFTDRLWLAYTSGITVKRYADYLSITASKAGTLNIGWKVYDESFNVLDSGTMQVVATADTTKTTKVLVIGDSTVTQSNAISQKLLDCYSASSGTLTLLGTKGASPALHEGRAGWTTTKYCTVADDNPFYNNGFDFSYYMTQRDYSGVDVVVIQLGINDIFTMTYENFDASTTLDNLDTMIASILAYNSNIKIIVDLISVPNGNGISFTDAYNTTQIDFVYLANTIRLSKAFIEHFKNNNSVTISPNNCVLDATTDINDGVHPNATGYAKLGQAIYETINGILEGVESPSYTNLLPSAIDSSGAVYNGTGWKDSTRINSSGVENTSTYTGTSLTGFIPAKTGDVFRFKNFKILTNGTASSSVRLGLYNSSKEFITVVPYTNLATGALNAVVDGNGCVTELTMTEAFLTTDITGVAFVRFMTYDEFATADSIITRNEPITD